MNNEIRNYKGEVIGFRCYQCGEVKDRMWGTTCNGCRNKVDEASKLRAEISKLTEEISKLRAGKQ